MSVTKEKKLEPLAIKRDYYQMIIDGERVDALSKETEPTFNPATAKSLPMFLKPLLKTLKELSGLHGKRLIMESGEDGRLESGQGF